MYIGDGFGVHHVDGREAALMFYASWMANILSCPRPHF